MENTSLKTTGKDFVKTFLLSLFLICVFAGLLTTFVAAWYGATPAEGFGSDKFFENMALFAIMAFIFVAVYAYMHYFEAKHLTVKNMTIVYLNMVLAIVISCICSDMLNIYVMPIQLCAIMVCLLVAPGVAAVSNISLVPLMLIIFFVKAPYSSETMAAVVASVFCGCIGGFVLLYLGSLRLTRMKFIGAGMGVGFLFAPFSAILTLALGQRGSEILSNALWVVVSNSVAIILQMPLVPIFETVFNAVTDYKLDELCSYSSPLIKRLSEEAPGTFNHSVIVGNLAEKCALAIGENTHMARAAAYYHDVGKLKSPAFFIENQAGGHNPHDDLIPDVSVSVISKHTKNGAQIIRENRLPEALAKVALEHHGTTPIKAFYYKALKLTDGGGLDDDMYRYDGPKPSTKIAAIIMICDSVEAAARAMNLHRPEEIEDLARKIVNERINDGQFDECDITMSDLSKIIEAIVSVLAGAFHTRVEYKK